MEGSFNFSNEYVEMLSGPAWTRELLASVRDAVAATKASVAATDDALEIHAAIAALRKETTATNAMLEQMIAANTAGKNKEWILFFLSTLLAVLTWAVPASDAGHLTTDVVAPIVRHLVEHPDLHP